MPKTINEGFEALISRLQPLNTEQAKVQSHKNSVYNNLQNNFGCYKFFDTGSFGNGTGVRHKSDSDYFGVLPSSDKLKENSTYTLKKVRESFQATFPNTKGISVSSPAIRIPFGVYASETMEITPCFFDGLKETPLGKYSQYLIPDGKGGWMNSSPEAHNAYVKLHNKRLKNDNVKKLIQLIKAWKYYNNVPIISFYLELRVTKYSENVKTINFDMAIKTILKQLLDSELANMRDPMWVSGIIPASTTVIQRKNALSKLCTAATRAQKAIEAKNKGKIEESYNLWNLLFNDKFPAR